MTQAAQHLAHAPSSDDGTRAQTLARRLAAAGLGVEVSRHRDTCQLTILGVMGGKSFVALGSSGHTRWYYEPAPGPSSSPAALAAIITYLLGASPGTASLAAYRALRTAAGPQADRVDARASSKSREPTSAMAVNESGLGSSADGKGEEGIDRSFERAGAPMYLGE